MWNIFLKSKAKAFISSLKSSIENIKYMFSMATKADRLLPPLMIAGMVVDAMLPFILVLFPKFILDALTEEKSLETSLFWVGMMFLTTFVIGGLNIILDGIVNCKKEKLIQQHYKNFSDKCMSMDLQDLETPEIQDKKAQAQKVITWNSKNIDGIKNAFGGILSFSLQIAGLAYIIIRLNFLIIISVFIVMIVNGALNRWNQRETRAIYEKQTPLDRMWAYLNQVIGDYSFGKIIRINQLGDWLLEKCKLNRGEALKFTRHQTTVSFRFTRLSFVLSWIQEFGVYIYLAYQAFIGSISLGDLFLYIAAVSTFTSAMTNFVAFCTDMNDTGQYVDDYREFLKLPATIDSQEGHELEKEELKEIRFDHVSFKYSGTAEYILKDICLTLDAHHSVSIVGENGAGKTTFIKLLMRLYEPTSGVIYLNGINIKDIKYSSYIRLFAPVFQDYQVYAFPVAENVALKDVDTMNEEEFNNIRKALEISGILPAVEALQEGIFTPVGKGFDENGIDFSGGEQQKLALARSVYKDADIVILDEPTANLSPIAEYQVYQSYHKGSSGKTAIYISHRLSSSIFCDRILVFDQGRIVEDGSHAELMQKDGIYKMMFDRQAEYYKEGEKSCE